MAAALSRPVRGGIVTVGGRTIAGASWAGRRSSWACRASALFVGVASAGDLRVVSGAGVAGGGAARGPPAWGPACPAGLWVSAGTTTASSTTAVTSSAAHTATAARGHCLRSVRPPPAGTGFPGNAPAGWAA
ncbi:hypothetical protein [Nonomuraea salmonea]|uniref:hypothetical protein n=1 Tax=Nonomuraea salmonea TaxID=46181 RepID=UPI0031EAB490